MRVLLVDDEQELVATLAERLEMRGIDAAWASDCATALEHVHKERFDIALLDVKLPSMNGLELKRLIDEAHIMPNWWIFIMASVSGAGAQA